MSEWIDAFPITAHVSDRLDHIYSDTGATKSTQREHGEELNHRRALDAHDRDLIYAEVEKYPHPLENNRPFSYNPVSGQIASTDVKCCRFNNNWRQDEKGI